MVVIINGKPKSGKSTFVEKCRGMLGSYRCHEIDTVDFIKLFAKQHGWEGEKTDKDRKFFSDFKKITTEWRDLSFQSTKRKLYTLYAMHETLDIMEDECLIFIHCREPQEIKRYVDIFNAKTLKITRPFIEDLPTSNSSDENVNEYEYDFIINNDGDIKKLEKLAASFIEKNIVEPREEF